MRRSRGRPSNKAERVALTAEILLKVSEEEVRVALGMDKAKGQRQLGRPFRKVILEKVRKEYLHRTKLEISVRTLERYATEHWREAIQSIATSVGKRLDERDAMHGRGAPKIRSAPRQASWREDELEISPAWATLPPDLQAAAWLKAVAAAPRKRVLRKK